MKSKSTINAVLSILVCALYLCATVGFDIHHDSHNQQCYVVSLLRGISCENIHPDDACKCCHNHLCHDDCGLPDHEDDCYNEIHQITVTGTDDKISIDLTPYFCYSASIGTERVFSASECSTRFSPRAKLPPDDILKLICILRV